MCRSVGEDLVILQTRCVCGVRELLERRRSYAGVLVRPENTQLTCCWNAEFSIWLRSPEVFRRATRVAWTTETINILEVGNICVAPRSASNPFKVTCNLSQTILVLAMTLANSVNIVRTATSNAGSFTT